MVIVKERTVDGQLGSCLPNCRCRQTYVRPGILGSRMETHLFDTKRIKGILAERNNPCSLQVASLITKWYTASPLLSKQTRGPPGCLYFLCDNAYVTTNCFFTLLFAPLAFIFLSIQARILFDTIWASGISIPHILGRLVTSYLDFLSSPTVSAMVGVGPSMPSLDKPADGSAAG